MVINTDNPSQRTPCLLVLDASGSMDVAAVNGKRRIDLLNEGLAVFNQSLREDELALSRVQIAAVNVGGPWTRPEVFYDWTDAIDFEPFVLSATGATPLGEAMIVALDNIEAHKANLRQSGISYTRPWIFILTDGSPTDNDEIWRQACSLTHEHEKAGKVTVFPIGVGDADMPKLSQLSSTPVKMMGSVKFRELFLWLSSSLGQVSRSAHGTKIDLPGTDAWSAVQL